jgi:hypothetical protein
MAAQDAARGLSILRDRLAVAAEGVGTPATKAEADVTDLAPESTDLNRENAELRWRLQAAEDERRIASEAHGVMALQIAQLEKLAREVKRAAERSPHWPVSRWVKFGPMAVFLASIKDQA